MNYNLNKERDLESNFHPNMFQNGYLQEKPSDTRTLLTIHQERGQKLTNPELKNLVSVGAYRLTENDNQLSGSNTRHLFKTMGPDQETLLTFLFFSKKNIDNIQNVIKHLVFKETNKIIDKQNPNELLIIMKSIYLEYSQHPRLFTPDLTQDQMKILQKQYTVEVDRLNNIVINELVPKIVSQFTQYLDYLRDANSPLLCLSPPESTNISGTRSYRSPTQIWTSGNL